MKIKILGLFVFLSIFNTSFAQQTNTSVAPTKAEQEIVNLSSKNGNGCPIKTPIP